MQTRNEKQRNREERNKQQKNESTNPNQATTNQGGLRSGWLSFFPEPDATVYGINHDCIVAVLTEANWRSAAVVRIESETNRKEANRNESMMEKVDDGRWLYLWIRESETPSQRMPLQSTPSQPAFQVRCFATHPCLCYEVQFEDLVKALDYINGLQPQSELARHTRIARREEWPPEMEAVSFNTGYSINPNTCTKNMESDLVVVECSYFCR